MTVYIVSTHIYGAPRYFAHIMRRTKGKPGAKKGVPKPLRHALDRSFVDRLTQAVGRAKLLDPDGEPLYQEIANKCEVGTRQVFWNYFNVPKERRTIDVVMLLGICDGLSVSPYWLVLNDGTLNDIPMGERPFEHLRKNKVRAEVGSETHREGKRGSDAVAGARRTTA